MINLIVYIKLMSLFFIGMTLAPSLTLAQNKGNTLWSCSSEDQELQFTVYENDRGTTIELDTSLTLGGRNFERASCFVDAPSLVEQIKARTNLPLHFSGTTSFDRYCIPDMTLIIFSQSGLSNSYNAHIEISVIDYTSGRYLDKPGYSSLDSTKLGKDVICTWSGVRR